MVQHALAGAAALTGMGQRTWHRLGVWGREAELETSTTPSRGLSHCSTRLDRQAPPCACRRISHGWARPATLPCYSARACSRKPPREPPGVELRRGSHDPGRRGGSCRVTQDTASRTAAPSPCQSNKHFDLLLRVFLSPHMAPTQAAVEEKDAAGMPATVLGTPPHLPTHFTPFLRLRCRHLPRHDPPYHTKTHLNPVHLLQAVDSPFKVRGR